MDECGSVRRGKGGRPRLQPVEYSRYSGPDVGLPALVRKCESVGCGKGGSPRVRTAQQLVEFVPAAPPRPAIFHKLPYPRPHFVHTLVPGGSVRTSGAISTSPLNSSVLLQAASIDTQHPMEWPTANTGRSGCCGLQHRKVFKTRASGLKKCGQVWGVSEHGQVGVLWPAARESVGNGMMWCGEKGQV